MNSSNRVFETMKSQSSNLSPPPTPFELSTPVQRLQSSDNNNTLDNKVSPSILLIIIILAIIFFISGLLHLLVRFLLKPPNTRDPDDFDNNVTALQGQLQQLFHLHDSGVDQTFIDSLPIFHYKEIIGIKDPFDCAVCLCEFVSEDKLRLLPKCSHAFHMDCIDTWLLSHSTCPLCRSSLLALFDNNYPSLNNINSDGCLLPMPVVCVLESGSNDTSREIGGSGSSTDKDSGLLSSLLGNISGSSSRRNIGDSEFGSSRRKSSCEIRNEVHDNSVSNHHQAGDHHQKIVAIKLGKFRNMDGFVGEGSSTIENNSTNNNSQNRNVGDGGSRRCYSMGSFAYVLDETSSLQVPVSSLTKTKKKAIMNKKPPLRPGHRSAISEYGSDSRREFNGVEAFATIDQLCSSGGGSKDKDKGQGNARLIEKSRKDSFSFSKIWLRGDKKDKGNNSNAAASSKKVVSSRFSAQLSTSTAVAGGGVSKSGNIGRSTGNWKSSESVSDQIEIEMEENGGGGSDEETQSCYSYDSQAMQQTSSSNRKTLYWLMTKQNKVVHSSFSSNV